MSRSILTFLVTIIFILSNAHLLAISSSSANKTHQYGASSIEELPFLSIVYVDGGDFIHGERYDLQALTKKIEAHPDVIELNLSGQVLFSQLMATIHQSMPKLKQIMLTGSIRFHKKEGLENSFETLNQQSITEEMLEALFQSSSPLVMIDLSMTTVNDRGLAQIALGGHNLRDVNLQGAANVTDIGVSALVDNLPNLKVIELGSVILRDQKGKQQIIAPQISKKLIEDLKNRGVTVTQDVRTPWF